MDTQQPKIDREEHLKHHIRELCGTIEEYVHMPCRSLRTRMVQAAVRAEKALEEPR